MIRMLLTSLLGLTLTMSVALTDDKKTDDKDKKKTEATITKVDKKDHKLTVKMKDKEGKDVEKVFKLTETISYLDSTGKVAEIDIFKNGDEVLLVEEEGQLKEVHKKKDKKDGK